MHTRSLSIGAWAVTAVMLAACSTSQYFPVTPASLYAQMTPQDNAQSAATLQLALNSSNGLEPRTWRNSATGNQGTVTPMRSYVTNAGIRCTDYREFLIVGGREATALNTACLSADGSWRRMATTPTP